MKKRVCTVIGSLLCLFVFLAMPVTASEKYSTKRFDVDMTVRENHQYEITETITVDFTEPCHGIYRYIPIKGSFYLEINGKPVETSYTAPIKNIRVDNEDVDISDSGENKLLVIGSEDKILTGEHTYVIHYTLDPGDDSIKDFDIVYYNLLPFNWTTPIESAGFRVTMPKDFDASEVNLYRGTYGATTEGTLTHTVDGKTISGEITAPLSAGEGVTLNLKLPEGYFVGARTGFEGIKYVYIFGALFLIAGLAVYFLLGRNQKPVEVVGFYPPHRFTPPIIGTIFRGRPDNRDIIASMIYLADKGCLTIEELPKKKLVLHRVKDPEQDEADHIKTIFNGLFPGEQTECHPEKTGQHFYEDAMAAKAQTEAYFADPKNALFAHDPLLIQCIMVLFGILTMLSFAFARTWFSSGMLSFWEVIIYFLLYGLVPLVLFFLIGETCHQRQILTKGKLILRVVLYGIMLVGVMILAFRRKDGVFAMALAFSYLVSAVLVVLSFACGKRTEQGNQWLGEVLGFRNFLITAEKDRINMLVDAHPDYFFHILPYAWVLGVTDQWAEKFRDLQLTAPVWYSPYGRSPDMFDIIIFSHIMRRNMSYMQSNMIHRPIEVSSGKGGFGSGGFGSGGGFAGGGIGGGGGGAW